MTQLKWTDKETERLLELKKTLNNSQVAKELARTKDSVRHRLAWLKDKKLFESPIPSPVAIKVVKEDVQQEKNGKPLRKKEPSKHQVSYPPLEWCPTCHSPVSNWIDHRNRMGCVRPA